MREEMAEEEERVREFFNPSNEFSRPSSAEMLILKYEYDAAIRASMSDCKPSKNPADSGGLMDVRPESTIMRDKQLTRNIGDIFG